MANEATNTLTKMKKGGIKGFFKSIKEWLRGMKSELKKVVWPSRKQVINNTIVAVVVMVVSAVVIWGFDELASMFVNLLISLAR